MADVSLHHVSKSFGTLPIIDDLDLTIADGEFVILVGGSGCGKSTTLRIIAGLETATSGQVSIGGRDVTRVAPGQRNCAMVFQSYALYPHMRVGENISFGMRLRGLSSADRDSAARAAARTLGLETLLDRFPRALSGGQRQRVAIGRAIEPLSNLDAKLRIEMRSEIKDLHRRIGATMVYVTHDQVEAMTMADRVVVMDKGRVAQSAAPINLYDYPANMFVAGFIGAPSMNFLPGRIVEGPAFRLDIGETVAFPPAAAERLLPHVGIPAVLGIRPEHLSLQADGIPMQVRSVEPLGSHTLAIGRVGGASVTAQVGARDEVRPDDIIRLRPDMERAHLFHPETTDRIK
jgi:multiple sugar transport system ATP-binding protein